MRTKGNRRSLHYATPYFLLVLVASANFMRLSLLKAAHAVVSVSRGRKIRVRYPVFPVELGGVGALHAAFLNESSTRGNVQRCVAGNPGPVEMTILWWGEIPLFRGPLVEMFF